MQVQSRKVEYVRRVYFFEAVSCEEFCRHAPVYCLGGISLWIVLQEGPEGIPEERPDEPRVFETVDNAQVFRPDIVLAERGIKVAFVHFPRVKPFQVPANLDLAVAVWLYLVVAVCGGYERKADRGVYENVQCVAKRVKKKVYRLQDTLPVPRSLETET